MQVYNVTMLAPTQVGKTTLLAVMWDGFKKAVGAADLNVHATGQTAVRLTQTLNDLKTMLARSDTFKVGPGINGTMGEEVYPLFLSRKAGGINESEIEIRFHDFPGGWFAGTDEQQKKIGNMIENCDVILIPINSPPLIHDKGLWHDAYNNPSAVSNLIQSHLSANAVKAKSRLVLFVPLKSEYYLQNDRDSEALVDRVQESYRTWFDHLACDRLKEHTAVAITPIQTLGNVLFQYAEPDGTNPPVFVFGKKDPRAGYEPKDADQLLRYLLSFFFEKYRREASIWTRTLALFWGSEFLDAAEKFGRDKKRTTPFRVVQDAGGLI